MKEHTHRKVKGQEKDYGFMGCVNLEHPNEAAHGNITRIDVCRCGATRKTNINGISHERGKWEE